MFGSRAVSGSGVLSRGLIMICHTIFWGFHNRSIVIIPVITVHRTPLKEPYSNS